MSSIPAMLRCGVGLPTLLDLFLARWNDHDVPGVVSLYRDDAEMEDPTLAAAIRGKRALSIYYARLWSASPSARLTCSCAEEGAAGIAWTWRFAGATAGRRWEAVGASFFRVEDGLIARDRAVWDPTELEGRVAHQ